MQRNSQIYKAKFPSADAIFQICGLIFHLRQCKITPERQENCLIIAHKNYFVNRKGEKSMEDSDRDFLIQAIAQAIAKCDDIDLLYIVYKILIADDLQ